MNTVVRLPTWSYMVVNALAVADDCDIPTELARLIEKEFQSPERRELRQEMLDEPREE